jgi:hypothetical protein
VQDDSDANGSNGLGRSLPLFDPVAGMRAIADIQAEGLRAASDLLERMLERDRDAPSAPSSEADRESARPRSSEDYTTLVDTWAQLLQRVAAGLAQPARSGAVTVAVDSTAGGPPVRLVVAPTEHASAAAEVWLHNGTAAAVGPLALGCGALVAASGEVLDGEVRFDPVEIPRLPPRSSRGVLVSATAGGTRRPGIYRGVIQADRAPNLWLPVEVAVEPC